MVVSHSDLETAVLPCGRENVTVVLTCPAELEPSWQTHVGGKLYGHLVLPHVDQVSLGQSVCNTDTGGLETI